MCHLLSRSHKLFWIASRVSRVIFFFTSIIFGCWLRRLSTVPPPRHAYTHPATISSPSTPPAPIHICHTLLSTPHHHLLRLFSLPATAPLPHPPLLPGCHLLSAACCTAAVLQWQIKVHRGRQESLPTTPAMEDLKSYQLPALCASPLHVQRRGKGH